MWLVDENLPPSLYKVFLNRGIECQSAQFAGVSGMKNGVLTCQIARMGFTCIITQDRLFATDAAAALSRNPQIAVVVVRLPQTPAKTYIQRFVEALDADSIKPIAGQVIFWPPNLF